MKTSDRKEFFRMARAMHAESIFKNTPFTKEKISGLFNKVVQNPNYRCYVVFSKGDFVGVLIFGIYEYYFSTAKFSDDVAFYVYPKHRGGLVGVKLLRHYVREAIKLGLNEIRLSTSTGIDNERVGLFLEKLGMKPIGGTYSYFPLAGENGNSIPQQLQTKSM